MNGGESWSSWYNQSTAQMYHVNADNAFPYRLCSGQQESGSACIRSRGNDGQITFREWHPVAAEEYGYVVPDPLDPDIVYGGKLTRYNRLTDQAQNVSPNPLRAGDFRVLRTEPIVFSPHDPHLMYFAANTLWATRDGGQSWKQMSPDLTRKTFEVPATVGIFKSDPAAQPKQRGVIYAVAPSPLDGNRIWAGTDDGLIWLTADGAKNWNDVTPQQLSAWQKVSIIEASHFDAQTAYAAINTLRLDDLRPHIYRTRDSGKSWTEIVSGIPADENVNAVREDPEKKGLLFASTERATYVSFDDGEQWQSLRLNMPATSVRDVIVKNDDLAVGTHGRGFWILDDIAPLRQIDAKVLASDAFLFSPELTYRVRWDMNTDTPLPPDEPAGENPPDGAILDYYLKANASGPVTLEILDGNSKLVRHYSSTDPVPAPDLGLDIPTYWVRPPQSLSGAAGLHRFLWDMHYAPVPGIQPEYPIAAIYHDTAPGPTSPWAMPGKYTVVLTADGKKYSQPLTVQMDPRVRTPAAGLQQQFDVSYRLYQDLMTLQPIIGQVTALRTKLDAARIKASSADAAKYADLDKKLDTFAGAEGRRRGPQLDTLAGTQAALLGLMTLVQDSDVAPATQVVEAGKGLNTSTESLVERWKKIEASDVEPLKQQLGISDLRQLVPPPTPESPSHSVDKDDD